MEGSYWQDVVQKGKTIRMSAHKEGTTSLKLLQTWQKQHVTRKIYEELEKKQR